MANSGHPASLYGGNEEGMGFLMFEQNTGRGYETTDPFDMFGSPRFPQNPTMGIRINSQTDDLPPEIGLPDQPNINVRTGPTPMTEEELAALRKEKKKVTDKKHNEKQKRELGRLRDVEKKFIEMQIEMKILQHENTALKENKETLESMIDVLKSNLDEVKRKHNKQEDLVRSLTEQGSLLEQQLGGGDLEAENDSKKKRKRTVRSCERQSGKETRQVALASKKACYDAGAERYGSTSYPTAKVDPHSITACLDILKTMGNIKYATVQKATAKFKSSDERETFVGLTDDWRKDWVKDLQ